MQVLYDPANFLDSSCFSAINSLSDQSSLSSDSFSEEPMASFYNEHTRLCSGSAISSLLPHIVSMDPTEQEQLLRAATGSAKEKLVPEAASILPSETIFSNLRIQTGQVPGSILTSGQLVSVLQTELDGNIIDMSDKFLSLIFPPDFTPCKINDSLFLALKKHKLWDASNNRFIPPSNYKEATFSKWLNSIGEVMSKHLKISLKRKWWHGSSTWALSGSDYNRKPDLSLLDVEYIKTIQKGSRIDWRFICSFAEVTSKKNYPVRITNTVTAKSFVMFACQHNRRFVPALSFIGNGRFMLTLTDREGQLCFECGNLTQMNVDAANNLLLILSYLMFGVTSNVGLDPHFLCGDETGSVTAINIDGNTYQLVQRIYTLEKLLGRGMKVWIVSKGKDLYILKDSWIQADCVESEIDHLKRMQDCEELKDHVPTLICGGDVYINGRPDSTGNYCTASHGKPSACRLHRHIITSPIGEPITNFRSKKEFISSLIDVIDAHKILTEKLKILHHDVSINNLLICRSDKNKMANGMIIDFDYTETIKDTTEGAIAVNAVEDSGTSLPPDKKDVKSCVHEDLVVVSESTSDCRDTDDAVANSLVDNVLDIKQEQLWTGTPPFMAIEALINFGGHFTHMPRHDLESILYIILYVCTYLNRPGSYHKLSDIPPKFTIPLGRWFKQDYVKEIGRSKMGHIETYDLAITPKFTPYWDDFLPFVVELIKGCFPTWVSMPNLLMHATMREILERAKDAVSKPDPLKLGSKWPSREGSSHAHTFK